jgi:RNAse (barnase) inhibitor barstar
MEKYRYIHFIHCDSEHLNKIISDISENTDTYLAEVEGEKCTTLDDLFFEFKKSFKFPDYFGYNWAAFDECLNDLDWISAKSYALILKDMDEVLPNDKHNFAILIKYLCRATVEWTQGRNYDDFPTPKTAFHLYFHSWKRGEEDLIQRIGDNYCSELRDAE